MGETKMNYSAVDTCIARLADLIEDANELKNTISDTKTAYTITHADTLNAAIALCDNCIDAVDQNIMLANSFSKMLTRAKTLYKDMDDSMASDIDGDENK